MNPGLYLVSTPIGNLGDMSFRAVETLKSADEIWAEDTRNTRRLLNFFEIDLASRPLRTCHDHNERVMAQTMVEKVKSGQAIAYVSDAGMPLISDPGFRLVQGAQEADIYYTALPGASAVPAALALSGMPSDRFAFLGFVPPKDSKRQKFFEELPALHMTVLAFESPRRVFATLQVARQYLGGEAQVAIVREISKKFEEVIKGSLKKLLAILDSQDIKGEIVLVFAPIKRSRSSDTTIDKALMSALKKMSTKDAANFVADQFSLPKRAVYERALELLNQQ